MALLVRQQSLEIPVDFFGFSLQDGDDTQVPVPFPDDSLDGGGGFLTAFEGRVDVKSAGHTHRALLKAEVWEGEPPADDSQAWEAQGEVEIRSTSGTLAVWVVGGATEEDLDLGRPGVLWKLRLYCAGREEVARLAELGVPHGVERYVAKFWSVSPEGGGSGV
ncbi:hypothetical protein ABZU86_13580 [Streptomyces sp. NPDC005271]|uniref:hypothetical protein n=1 Tax=unclassified Streptomyces TaxID=2593676 RepID=UPI0033B87E48